MLCTRIVISAWQANCYVIATNSGSDCLIVDPGPGAARRLPDVLASHDVTPAGVWLTHGHVDHVADVAAICERYGIPAWLHPADRHLLTDPAAGIGSQFADVLTGMLGDDAPTTWREPADLRDLADGDAVEIAGLAITAVAAPGHTPGCVLGLIDSPDGPLCLSGDVLFAGSIGRTDLPGGNNADMAHTLATRVVTLNPQTRVLPGHGPETTIARELASNRYLADR